MARYKDYPFVSRYAEVCGYRMHYLDEGQGPVVVLLHGNPTWSYYYRHLIRTLRERFRVIAPDHIGCGLSEHPRDVSFRAADRMQHLEQLFAQLGLTSYSMVMHDWGGPIGSGVAVRHPEALQRIVYLNTTLTETESLPAIIKNAAHPLLGRFITQYSMQFLRLTTTVGAARGLDRETRAGYYAPYRSIADRKAIWDFVADIPFSASHPTHEQMSILAEKLPLLREVPTLILWGLKDPCFHRGMLDKVAIHFPQAEIHEYPNASHLVLEDERDDVCRRIEQFLSGGSDRSQGRGKRAPEASQVEVASPPEGGQLSGSTGVARTTERGGLYRRFVAIAERQPHETACVSVSSRRGEQSYRTVVYGELLNLVRQYERGLNELGLERGDRVLMLVTPGVDFLALSYAVMGRGGVPLFVDPGIGRELLVKCINDTAPHAFIGVPRAHALRLLMRARFRGLKFKVSTGEFPIPGAVTTGVLKRFSSLPLSPVADRAPDAAALIACTSGATGTPKGVVFSEAMLDAQCRILSEQFGLEAGTLDLPLLPIFSLFQLALGVGSVFVPLDPGKPLALDPQQIVQVCNELSVRSSFGSPTLWNKISDYCVRSGQKLHTVRQVFMAGAPVPAAVLTRVRDVLANGEAFTPYGATEALPVTLVSGEELLNRPLVAAQSGEQGTPVGRPVQGVRVRIAQVIESEQGHTLHDVAPRQIGEVLVSGENVSTAYLNRPDANRSGKVVSDGVVWHRMGDIGYRDEEGYLFFCGRRAHVVRSGERTWYPIPVERIFNEHPKVRRCALVKLDRAPGVGLAVEPLPQFWPATDAACEQLREELRQLAAAHPLTKELREFFFHPSFPVDGRHNAKIFRDKLSQWASDAQRRDRAILEAA